MQTYSTKRRRFKNRRTDDQKTLAGRLYVMRKKLGISGQKLATLAEITNASYCRYECSLQTGMNAETLFKLADALGCSAEWLFRGNVNDIGI